MRQLTAKQKQLLKKWYKLTEPSNIEKMLYNKSNPLINVDALTDEQYQSLVDINNTEILCQEINRFLSDLHFKSILT